MSIFEKIDSFFCSTIQIPLVYYKAFLTEKNELTKYYFIRFLSWFFYLASVVLQAVSLFYLIKGSNYFALAGLFFILQFIFGQLTAVTTNYLALKLREIVLLGFKTIENFKTILDAYLKNKGFTESEIGYIQNVRNTLYMSELTRVFVTEVGLYLSSISIIIVFVLTGQITWAIVVFVVFIGTIYLKGKYLIKDFSTRTTLSLYANYSMNVPLLKAMNLSHLFYTLKVNLISNLSILISGLSLIFPIGSNVLAAFWGISTAIGQIEGAYSKVSERFETEAKIRLIKSLFEMMGSNNFLISLDNLVQHMEKKSEIITTNNENGILINNFKLNLDFLESNQIEEFNLFINYGDVAVIKAISGKGKTTLVNAIAHKINHSGDIVAIEGDKKLDIHSYIQKNKIEKFVKFFSTDDITPTLTISEIFNPILLSNVKNSFKGIEHSIVQTGLSLSKSMLNDFTNKTGNRVKPEIIEVVTKHIQNRENYVNKLLSNTKGNLNNKNINSERIFSTLSSGEKLRLITLFAKEYVKIFKPKLIIMDEPFGQLDKEINLPIQVEVIKSIIKQKNPPSVIIISHQYIEVLEKELKAKVINL